MSDRDSFLQEQQAEAEARSLLQLQRGARALEAMLQEQVQVLRSELQEVEKDRDEKVGRLERRLQASIQQEMDGAREEILAQKMYESWKEKASLPKVKGLESELASYGQLRLSLTNELSEQRQTLRILQQECAELQALRAMAASNHAADYERITTLECEVATLQANLHAVVGTCQDELRAEQEEMRAMRKAAREAEDRAAVQKREAERRLQEQAEASREVDQLKAELAAAAAEQAAAAAQRQGHNLRDELQTLREELSEQKLQATQKRDEGRDFRDELQTLRQELADAQANQENKEEGRDYRKELQILREELVDQKAQAKREKEEVERRAAARLQEMRRRHRDMRSLDHVEAGLAKKLAEAEKAGWHTVRWGDHGYGEGFTLLHWAAKNDNAYACEKFLGMGADPNQKDAHGMTAADYAKDYDCQAALEVLQDGGRRRGTAASDATFPRPSLRSSGLGK